MNATTKLAAGLLLLAAGQMAAAAETQVPPEPETGPLPDGSYTLDRPHASVTFRISHLGFSHFTARFTGLDATLELDPADPGTAQLTATIATDSLETDYPLDDVDFDALLSGPEWLDAAQFPEIVYRSTAIELTGPSTAEVTGDLSLHGVTRPVTLAVTFNGGYASHPWDPAGSRIGFSAQGRLLRSQFGVALGIPAEGSSFGVGDEVEILIEAEFTRPRDDRGGGGAQ